MKRPLTRRSALRGASGLAFACGLFACWHAGLFRWNLGVSEPASPLPASPRERPPVSSQKQGVTARAALTPDRVPGANYAAALAMFREYSKYPPNSRPIDDSHSDVAEPMTIAAGPQALRRTDAAGKQVGTGVFCVMQPVLHHVMSGQTQRLTLRCVRGLDRDAPSALGLPLLIESLEAEVMAGAGSSSLPLPGVAFADDGARDDAVAGDGTYAATVPIAEQQAPGLVTLTARLRLANREASDSLDPQPVHAQFSISPPAPARFTGHVSDGVRGGSLVVTVELQVNRPGRYRVFANLEQTENLLAYAKEDRELAAGTQRVELLFFGKILHDSGADGAFQVTHLRGERLNLDDDVAASLSDPLEPVERAHTTAAYRSADFSPAEWSSPYKEERIAELSALAAAEGK